MTLSRSIIILFILINKSIVWGQSLTDSTTLISLSGYAETYFGYASQQSRSSAKEDFIYSHNLTNQIGVNLAFLKGNLSAANYRANLALMVGSYAAANLANEPAEYRNILEANVGIKLSKSHNLWLDAGVMPSHIGLESTISKDCMTLTRSIIADNSPYFETGAKLSYTTNDEKWMFAILVLNGWQNIISQEENNISFGSQITFKPNKKIVLNSSSFIGKVNIFENNLRFFHDLYLTYDLDKKWSLSASFDIGRQSENRYNNNTGPHFWNGYALIAEYKINKKFGLAFRTERYSDPSAIILSGDYIGTDYIMGNSLNFDWHISQAALWRMEAKRFDSDDDLFFDLDPIAFKNHNYLWTTSIAVAF